MLYMLFFGCFFLAMLLFPSLSFEGACKGLVLWFQTVLPTLLPFIIVSNLLVYSKGIHLISQKIGFLFQKVFSVSYTGCYPILVGFLCGYPMGAKTIADMVKTNLISKKEGQYLLSFCNNTSPMFIIGYLTLQNFQETKLALPCLVILIGTPIFCSFIFRHFYITSDICFQSPNSNPERILFNFSLLDRAIMNGFETITRVGGYIILFSILFVILEQLPNSLGVAFLEITNGIPLLWHSELSYHLRFSFCLALVSFGGVCSIIQTRAMIQDSGLSIHPYIKEKLITAIVTSLIAYIYILFIH